MTTGPTLPRVSATGRRTSSRVYICVTPTATSTGHPAPLQLRLSCRNEGVKVQNPISSRPQLYAHHAGYTLIDLDTSHDRKSAAAGWKFSQPFTALPHEPHASERRRAADMDFMTDRDVQKVSCTITINNLRYSKLHFLIIWDVCSYLGA